MKRNNSQNSGPQRAVVKNYTLTFTQNYHLIKHFTLFLLFILLSAVGCGKKLLADLPKLYPASVTVIQDGQPLEGATVQLILKGFDSRWSAVSVSDTAGKVEFYTQGEYPGVPEGTYSVTVSKIFTEESRFGKMPPSSDTDAYKKWQQQLENEELKSYHNVDKMFGSKETTPLELKVGPGGETHQQIDVGKAINEEIKLPPR